jgi:hypothetical protein
LLQIPEGRFGGKLKFFFDGDSGFAKVLMEEEWKG